MPDLKRARPVMMQRMSSATLGVARGRKRTHSPQPSTSMSSGEPENRYAGSPAPLLADPLPKTNSRSPSRPDHEAFEDISLGFKSNVVRLVVLNDIVMLEFSGFPTDDGCCLTRQEFGVLKKGVETIDYHMSSRDKRGSDVRVWIHLKDRQDARGKPDIAYLTVRPFIGQLYVSLRDYWYPNGPEGGLSFTRRGVTLNLAGWKTLKSNISKIEEKWTLGENYLTAIEEDSQIITLE